MSNAVVNLYYRCRLVNNISCRICKYGQDLSPYRISHA